MHILEGIHDPILFSTYAFCAGFDYGARTSDFLLTHNRSLAAHYLQESGYCVSARTVLFIVINFIFASIRLTERNVPTEPFIESCRMTTVALVFPSPTGRSTQRRSRRSRARSSSG
jgi:uncharacterized membrane protein